MSKKHIQIEIFIRILSHYDIFESLAQYLNSSEYVNDTKLSDYNQIWSKFCFLDETGSLKNVQDNYFTIGILKMSQPYYLQRRIHYERNKINFYDELKFNKLSKNNIEFAKIAVDALFETKSVWFYSYSITTQSGYFERTFSENPWYAYEQITLKVLSAAISRQEILVLIADYVTTPKEVRFEVNVKTKFNNLKKYLALVGVCRFDSKSNDLLQLVDLVIGAINYDLKYRAGQVSGSKYKLELVKYLKNKLGTESFIGGFRNHNFNIFVNKENPLESYGETHSLAEPNEKGLSS